MYSFKFQEYLKKSNTFSFCSFKYLRLSPVFIIIFTLLFSTKMNAQSKKSLRALKNQIENRFHSLSGTFALAFYNPDNEETFVINADTIFHAASTMKTPVMIEVFKQAKEGKIQLNDSLVVRNEFKSIVDSSLYQLSPEDDSDAELYLHIGQKQTIYDLMYRMIIHSSNLATNIIIDLVGAKNVMKTIRAAGVMEMRVLRGVEDQKAYEAGLNNTTNARSLMILFKKISEGSMVDAASSAAMIRILEDQKHNEVIPALLPPGVKVAHKMGNITGVEHDSGIVFLPDGKKYVLVLLSKNLANRDEAVKMMAEVSKMIYDFVSAE